MKKYFNVFALVVCTLSVFAQVTINDVKLPATLNAEKTNLVLNGGGVRKKAFFKLYVAGLYVEQKTKNAEAIVNENKPVAIRLQITSSMINSENMSEAIQEGFGRSLKGNTKPLQPKIDAFIATFKKEAIKEGDIFDLYYVPGTGVKAYKNNKLQSTIEGLDFKKALLGIWLSATPVDDLLRQGLLGE
jgi:hypothetical protein